ncbi:helix-turn-helix domain-containing protein [Azospirillum picis]|uniref:Transcriptional regulator with XRE-family HTH domain n=1 Tax=Azospirillum picis TaxID=488438 RepID=A0ABU0MFL7_9PROT|nr:XRE family transcriptional regulator [Azospirillum picis]MBP2298742.1 transcriptional regulator with XRE-family HTH domain [Azospirillum picis]MDQ0532209.1 transcriptional regulator with XRE-family HTH domain [Azospirillum picis]
MLAHVGANLRRLRQRAGLSQAALADASGISRRMIVNLEAGDTNVSLSSLDRLAEALGATFVEVVSDPAAESRRIEAVAWRGHGAESKAVLLGSVPARSEAQLWHWSLGPGERYAAEPDPEGWSEMVFVMQGCLRIELAEGERLVKAGDFAIYGSSQPYAYVNAADMVTLFIRNVVC